MGKPVGELIEAVIVREGGYVDHPADRGGATRWGITERVARGQGYRGDMRSLPRETAAAIYRRRYWSEPGLDRVAERDAGLAAELFDTGVNMGPARAGAFVQRALNVLNRGAADYPDLIVDGMMGAMTRAALDGYFARRGDGEGRAVLLWTVRALRTARYVEIAVADRSQEAFAYGWVARQVREAGA